MIRFIMLIIMIFTVGAILITATSLATYNWSSVKIDKNNDPPGPVSTLPSSIPTVSHEFATQFPTVFDNPKVGWNGIPFYFEDGNKLMIYCGLFEVNICAHNKSNGDVICSKNTVGAFTDLLAQWAVLAKGESGFLRMEDASFYATISAITGGGVLVIIFILDFLLLLNLPIVMKNRILVLTLYTGNILLNVIAIFGFTAALLVYPLYFGPNLPKYFYLDWSYYILIIPPIIVLEIICLLLLDLTIVFKQPGKREHSYQDDDDEHEKTPLKYDSDDENFNKLYT
eukprot:TRINITY_DN2236_c1_g1_i1.p1 TRINITY_DN2236_c1_g1~~TRINITY_DN2236_c1_g1_i1.p1  ORF type:complete len:284 (-),score=62.95 TRINITY_DN2236_c1_g1_i1:89-940(-)